MQGSAEAIVASLDKIGTDEVRARIIHSGAGGINESDVMLAKGSGASILGFNVRASRRPATWPSARAWRSATTRSSTTSGRHQRRALGHAGADPARDLPRQRRGAAGVRHLQGRQGRRLPGHRRHGRKGARVGIVRDDVVIQELACCTTLKRFKDEVNEVTAGQECGMAFENFQDIKQGDIIECFRTHIETRTL